MRYLILLTLILSKVCFAQLLDVQKAGFPSSQNIVYNPGGENNLAGWSSSGGTFTLDTTTHIGFGKASFEIDSGSTGQTYRSKQITIPDGLKGRNIAFGCDMKVPSGTSTYQIGLYDGTTETNLTTLSQNSTLWTRTVVNTVAPSSGTLGVEIKSVASNEPSIRIDECFIVEASAINLSQVNNVQFVGSAYFATTASCTWSRTNTSLGAFTTDADCPGPTVELNAGPGTIQTTDSDLPKVTINNLPAGTYEVHFVGPQALTSAAQAALAISDGTTNSGQVGVNQDTNNSGFHLTGFFTYTTSGNKSFELYASSASSNVNIDMAANNQRLYFYIVRYPTSSESAFRPELIQNAGKAVTDYATNCIWVGATTAAWTDFPTDSDCNTATLTGIAQAPTTSKTPAFKVTNLAAGSYMVYAIGAISENSADCRYRITDGTNHSAYMNVAANASGTLMGVFTYTSIQSSLDFKLQSFAVSGTDCRIYNQVDGNRFEMGIIPINQGISTPLLVGSVTSGSTGAERIERARITNSGTAAVSSQSGSWISSVSRTSAGIVQINMPAGTWSSAPSCVGAMYGASDYGYFISFSTTPSTTQLTANCLSHADVLADKNFEIICMGPR